MTAATNSIPYHADTVSMPGLGGFTVVPSDSANFPIMSRAIYVGGTGDVVAVMSTGDVLTFKAVPVGTLLPLIAQRINNTNTTATLMVALI